MTLHFFRNRQEAFAHSRRNEVRSLVAAVHVPSAKGKLSDLYLSDAAKARRDKVRNALATGQRIYEHDATKPNEDLGGLERDRQARAAERALDAQDRSEAQIAQLAAKWHERPTVSGRIAVPIDLRREFKGGVFPGPVGPTITTPDGRTIQDPDFLQCSFCDEWIHRNKATTGKGDLRRSKRLEIVIVNGEETIQEKIVYTSRRLVACAAHVLDIKPTVHRDGSITNNLDFLSKD